MKFISLGDENSKVKPRLELKFKANINRSIN